MGINKIVFITALIIIHQSTFSMEKEIEKEMPPVLCIQYSNPETPFNIGINEKLLMRTQAIPPNQIRMNYDWNRINARADSDNNNNRCTRSFRCGSYQCTIGPRCTAEDILCIGPCFLFSGCCKVIRMGYGPDITAASICSCDCNRMWFPTDLNVCAGWFSNDPPLIKCYSAMTIVFDWTTTIGLIGFGIFALSKTVTCTRIRTAR